MNKGLEKTSHQRKDLQDSIVQYWRRQWHPTPVLMRGKSHGWRSLVGYSPWGLEESDMTERLHFHFSLSCTGEGNGSSLQYSCRENPRDGSLVGCRLWGHTELDTTDVTQQQQQQHSIVQYSIYMSLPCNSAGKESACNKGDTSSIPGSGRSDGEGIGYPLQSSWASLVAQLLKNQPTMCKTWIQSLSWEDTLEKGTRITNILAWRIP